MKRPLRLGISPCPNDTFAFHGLLAGCVDTRGLDIRVELLDVQELNEGLLAGRFDAAKVSFHAALTRSGELAVLASGSAVGFGVGPVLLAGPAGGKAGSVLAPGALTTAALLYRLLHPRAEPLRHVVFSEIMPALAAGRAPRGVVIHEGRFTYQRYGLSLVEDLGATWEALTGAPLPLGGIAARRSLGEDVLRRLQDVVLDSLDHGLAHPEETRPTMRRHAQELDDAVIAAHVDLYVNAWTRDLGSEGRRALAALARRARFTGLLPADTPDLPVVAAG